MIKLFEKINEKINVKLAIFSLFLSLIFSFFATITVDYWEPILVSITTPVFGITYGLIYWALGDPIGAIILIIIALGFARIIRE